MLGAWTPVVTARQFVQSRGSFFRELYPGVQTHTCVTGVSSSQSRQFSRVPASLCNSTSNYRLQHPTSFLQNNVSRRVFPQSRPSHILRFFSSTDRYLESKSTARSTNTPQVNSTPTEKEDEEVDKGFELSERAAQAAKINLSAKLAKDGASGKKSGFKEIWRLLSIARPEAKKLGFAFLFLLVSSSITMSIPFSIGKIMDAATKSATEGGGELFGLSLPMFYGALAGVLT